MGKGKYFGNVTIEANAADAKASERNWVKHLFPICITIIFGISLARFIGVHQFIADVLGWGLHVSEFLMIGAISAASSYFVTWWMERRQAEEGQRP